MRAPFRHIFLDTASELVLQDCKFERFVKGGNIFVAARKEASSGPQPRDDEAGGKREASWLSRTLCEEVGC